MQSVGTENMGGRELDKKNNPWSKRQASDVFPQSCYPAWSLGFLRLKGSMSVFTVYIKSCKVPPNLVYRLYPPIGILLWPPERGLSKRKRSGHFIMDGSDQI